MLRSEVTTVVLPENMEVGFETGLWHGMHWRILSEKI
jgi:hypothetical protein